MSAQCDPAIPELNDSLLHGWRAHAINEHAMVRKLFASTGLRNSLFRVKVLVLLLRSPDVPLQTLAIHRMLEVQVGIALRLTNTRDVLRRLAHAGLAVQSDRGHYCISRQTISRLNELAGNMEQAGEDLV